MTPGKCEILITNSHEENINNLNYKKPENQKSDYAPWHQSYVLS
jgi:hypothetical protein